MTLTDADMLAAGNAALRLLGLPECAEVTSRDEDFAFIGVRLPGGDELVGSNGIWWNGDRANAIEQVLDGITNDISETETFRAVAFPRCDGHLHPADYGVDERGAWLRCPRTGAEIGRVPLP